MNLKKWRLVITFSLLIVLPIFFLLLPATQFDEGQSICPSKAFLNIECLGCGLTRGIQHLIHFNFKQAWEFNKLSFVVLPIIVYLYLKFIIKITKKFKNEKTTT